MKPALQQSLFLQSADGGIWEITVNNTGQVLTQKIGTAPVPLPFSTT